MFELALWKALQSFPFTIEIGPYLNGNCKLSFFPFKLYSCRETSDLRAIVTKAMKSWILFQLPVFTLEKLKFEFIWAQKSKNKSKLEQVKVRRRKCSLTVLPVAFASLKSTVWWLRKLNWPMHALIAQCHSLPSFQACWTSSTSWSRSTSRWTSSTSASLSSEPSSLRR